MEWNFDYYVVYLLYNERKADQYTQYMKAKWSSNTDDSLL